MGLNNSTESIGIGLLKNTIFLFPSFISGRCVFFVFYIVCVDNDLMSILYKNNRVIKKDPIVETTGGKPKPTAYEKNV
jgi:hypothetical protein